MPVFVASLLIVAKRRKQPNCPSVDEWVNQMWCLLTMENYRAIKRVGALIRSTAWINLEKIVLSEIRQTERTNTTWLHSYETSRMGRFIERENRGHQGWGRGSRTYCLMVTGFLSGGDNVVGTDRGDGGTPLNRTQHWLNWPILWYMKFT